jgi:cation transport ATPase
VRHEPFISQLEISVSTEGYVYILTNPVMQGLIKIGKTCRTIEERVKELNGTGVPMPFEVAYSRKVEYMDEVERDMHEHFNVCRVNDGREFFRLSIGSAVTKLDTYQEALSEAERRAEREVRQQEYERQTAKREAELADQNRKFRRKEKIAKAKQRAELFAYDEANKLNGERTDAAFKAFYISTALVVVSFALISFVLHETGIAPSSSFSLLQGWLMFFAYLGVGWKIGHRLATRNRVHFDLWESLGHYQQSLFN